MKQLPKKIFAILLPIVCSACVIAFTFLCIQNFHTGFIHEHAAVIVSLSIGIEIVYIAATVFFCVRRIEVVYKFLLTGLILAAVILVGLYIFQVTGFIDKIDSREDLQELIEKTGVWGPLAFILLQALQVFLLPIPGILTVGAGVFVFGPWKTSLFSYIGILLGSFVAFWIGRVIGYKAAAWLVGKDALDSWLKKVSGKDRRILTAMFLLPVFPDDILCFVAGLSTMTWRYFIIMQIISRAISVVLTSFSMEGMIIPYTTWWGLLCWAVIGIAIIFLFILIYKKGDKIEAWFTNLFKSKKKAEKDAEPSPLRIKSEEKDGSEK